MLPSTERRQRRHTPRIVGLDVVRERPAVGATLALLLFALVLIITEGLHDVGQTTVNGLVTGSYFALGAVGLTLVYGILRLVNFAHGDFLTFGAYIAFWINVTLGLHVVVAAIVAVLATAALGVALELVMWRPMRARNAGMLQLILMSIGLAFLIRNGIQLVAGSEQRNLDVNVTNSVHFLGLRVGTTQLAVIGIGFAVLIVTGLMLRFTSLGKQMRALSDNYDLAETTGIDAGLIVIVTWIFAGGLAGLAGVLYTASIGVITPNVGFQLLLSLFAAVILGGIGSAYGALAAGIVLGLVEEWSTLFIPARWKLAVGFAMLIITLIVRPQGLFGQARQL